MDEITKRTAGVIRGSGNSAYRAGQSDISKYILVPCKVLLVPSGKYLSGGASIKAKCQSQVIGWRDLFYEQSVPRKIIIQIKKKEEKIIPGKASIMYNGSVADVVLSDSEERKLKLVSKRVQELLKAEELEQRDITPKMAWILAHEFNEKYLEMALNSKRPVLYSNLELRLPLL